MSKRRKSVSLAAGDVQEVTTPLGVVVVEAGYGPASPTLAYQDTVDVRPKPTDARLDGRVLLANVQDRRHVVRLVALPLPVDDVPWDGLTDGVREERLDLVHRVLAALHDETGLPTTPAARDADEVVRAVAGRVRW